MLSKGIKFAKKEKKSANRSTFLSKKLVTLKTTIVTVKWITFHRSLVTVVELELMAKGFVKKVSPVV